MIGGTAPAAQAVIEGLQPYHRKDTVQKDRLWQLHWLDIEDKHRLPHVGLFTQMGSAFFVPDNLAVDDIELMFGFIERRAPIARYPAFDSTGAEVNVQPQPSLSISFGQRVPRQLRTMPIPDRLTFIHHHLVTNVIPPLTPFLTGH
jgi:hypothetical protein